MMNKAEKNKLKNIARKIAESRKLKYEDALDHVARESGYIDWKSLDEGPKKVNFEAYVTYGIENVKDNVTVSLSQAEAINLIKCFESYIDVYASLIEKQSEYIEELIQQKDLTYILKEKILSLAGRKVQEKDESSLELLLSGYELGQFITLLFDYGKSIEEYMVKLEDIDENKQERFYLIQIGGIFGDILSKVTESLKK